MILIVFIITFFYCSLIGYFIVGFDKVEEFDVHNLTEKTKFSIIIPFRNEIENLLDLLQSLSELNYPKNLFEILLVDDASEDDSVEIINTFIKGQYLKAIIPGEKVKDAIELPRNILVDASHVYVVEDSLLKRVQIHVHKVNAETVVFNGIPEGADIVMEQLINAANNMKVYKLSDDGKDIDLENKIDASVANNN